MNTCELCGSTKILSDWDGNLYCKPCQDEDIRREKAAKAAKNARRNASRRARDEAARSCGLVKVRGNLGGTYYE